MHIDSKATIDGWQLQAPTRRAVLDSEAKRMLQTEWAEPSDESEDNAGGTTMHPDTCGGAAASSRHQVTRRGFG